MPEPAQSINLDDIPSRASDAGRVEADPAPLRNHGLRRQRVAGARGRRARDRASHRDGGQRHTPRGALLRRPRPRDVHGRRRRRSTRRQGTLVYVPDPGSVREATAAGGGNARLHRRRHARRSVHTFELGDASPSEGGRRASRSSVPAASPSTCGARSNRTASSTCRRFGRDEGGLALEVTLRLEGLRAADAPNRRAGEGVTHCVEVEGEASHDAALAAVAHILRLDAGSLPVLRAGRRRSRSGLGDARGRPHRSEPDRVRGRREDDLHDELRLVGDGSDGRRARRAPWRGRRPARRPTRHSVAPFRPRQRWRGARLDFYTDTVRAGYRGAYLRSLAESVAAGRARPRGARRRAPPMSSPTRRSRRSSSRSPASGPYAAAHIMMMLGRYSRLILDSWTRPKYAERHRRATSEGLDDRAALPPLRPLRGARVLARPDA